MVHTAEVCNQLPSRCFPAQNDFESFKELVNNTYQERLLDYLTSCSTYPRTEQAYLMPIGVLLTKEKYLRSRKNETTDFHL